MRRNIIYFGVFAGLVALFLYAGCKKESGYYDYKSTPHEFSGSTYDFLQSQTGVYDSFLLVLKRVGLADSLKKGKYTVFAPTNESFEEAITNMNNLRKNQGRPPLYLSTVPLEELDTLACLYIIPGIVPSDSMRDQDGLTFQAVRYGFNMNGKFVNTSAEGMVNGGPGVVQYSDTKGVVYTRQWSTSNTVSLDIKTSNGLVNVLEKNHEFGFDEFNGRMNPTKSQPYLGVPLDIPGTIGLEQYDKGGQNVAYWDNDATNNGHQYRDGEMVDIENAGNNENGYDVGWTYSTEWMKYTVNIAEAGTYKWYIRSAGSGNNGELHIEIDDVLVPNSRFRTEGDGNWQDYRNFGSTVTLPAGIHVLKLYYDFANYNLRFMSFLPDNRPFPVPGNIPCEEFNQGGEGVGYHDNSTSHDGPGGNAGYRLDEHVGIEQNKVGGGYDIGWTSDGEWLKYDINVLRTGDYSLAVRVGSPNPPNGGNRFHVEIDGDDVTGAMTCPNTGGWQNWTDIVSPRTIHLTKGKHVMTFYEETGGYNIRSYKFTALN